MLEIADLSVRYGKHTALDGINASVNAGEMVAILGANGAGKSSLLGSVGGRVKPASGTIRYKGADLLALPQHQLVEEGIALVPEGRGIFPAMSVEDNLSLGALPKRAQSGAAQRRDEVFALFPKLAQRRMQVAGTMSGGEQQMLAIGRALMSNPDMLFLDEPCASLDGRATREIEEILLLAAAGGTRLIMSTHNMGQAQRLADEVIFVLHGRIHEFSPAQQFFAGPKTPQAQAFLNGDIVE